MTSQWVVERKTLHGQLASHLRDMIMAGVFKPGEKIQEQDLCDRFDVSRTPIREALRVLAAEGLLTLTPNRGARIASSTAEEIEELYPLIGALEGLAGELACARITDAEIGAIDDLHRRMVAHYQKGEFVASKKLNQQIHDAIFQAAGNAALTMQYRNLMIRTHSIRYFVRKSPERWREAIDDHEKMMDALRARDGVRLGQILREHLQHKVGMIKEALDELQAPVSAR
jgi:DNA-binding GntR family transcriptional regulator